MRREYDETGYLEYYIFRWHGDLIPDAEKHPGDEYFQEVLPKVSIEDIKAIMSDGDLEVSSPQIERELLAAWDDYYDALCNRLIEKHKLKIRRCPKCNKILESPKAKLCLWCGYNEYKSSRASNDLAKE